MSETVKIKKSWLIAGGAVLAALLVGGLLAGGFFLGRGGLPAREKTVEQPPAQAGDYVTEMRYSVTGIDGEESLGTYTGHVVNGLPEDENGVFEYDDGAKYVGGWKDGKQHGWGTETYSFGEYVGEFRNGLPNGQGTLTENWGDVMSGEWKDGFPVAQNEEPAATAAPPTTTKAPTTTRATTTTKAATTTKATTQGTVREVYPNGSVYEGPIVNGKRNGYGTFSVYNGNKYVGNFVDGDYNGQGTFYFANGDKYVGNFVNGDFNGQGTMTYADGAKYVGNWKDDKRDGYGTYTFASGEKFVGNYKNGLRDGYGTLYNTNGTINKQGQWKDGVFQGTTTVTTTTTRAATTTTTTRAATTTTTTRAATSPPSTATNTRGNTTGNINGGGWVAKQGDWLYYSDHKNAIYKQRMDGTGKIQIVWGVNAYSLNVVGNYLYYTSYEGKDVNDFFRIYSLRRCNLNGGEQYTYCYCGEKMLVVDNQIYYSGSCEPRGVMYDSVRGPYSMSIDGSGVRKMNASFGDIADGYNYYGTASGLCKENLATGIKTTLCSINSPHDITVKGSTVYFVGPNNTGGTGDSIYSISTSGGSARALASVKNVFSLHVTDAYIYCTYADGLSSDDNAFRHIRVPLNGGVPSQDLGRICGNAAYGFNFGDNTFYQVVYQTSELVSQRF